MDTPVVTFCFETLPEDVQEALSSLGLEQDSFTSVELLETLKEKYPHLVLLFYTLIYQQLIAENADHLLVRVASIFDASNLMSPLLLTIRTMVLAESVTLVGRYWCAYFFCVG